MSLPNINIHITNLPDFIRLAPDEWFHSQIINNATGEGSSKARAEHARNGTLGKIVREPNKVSVLILDIEGQPLMTGTFLPLQIP